MTGQKSLLKNIKNDIIESDRENVIKIATAQLEFEKGNFNKVLESIADINADHIYSKVDIRNLTVMSYYELNYTESALSMLDSFKHFINGSRNMSGVFRENHMRFINSLHSLIINKEKKHIDKLEELKEKLLPYKNDRRSSWIISKIDLLINY